MKGNAFPPEPPEGTLLCGQLKTYSGSLTSRTVKFICVASIHYVCDNVIQQGQETNILSKCWSLLEAGENLRDLPTQWPSLLALVIGHCLNIVRA